jgi:hypothetical protein
MSAKVELHNINDNLSKRENIIQRIMNLSDEQFDRLITLYSQQEQESDPACQVLHRTSA